MFPRNLDWSSFQWDRHSSPALRQHGHYDRFSSAQNPFSCVQKVAERARKMNYARSFLGHHCVWCDVKEKRDDFPAVSKKKEMIFQPFQRKKRWFSSRQKSVRLRRKSAPRVTNSWLILGRSDSTNWLVWPESISPGSKESNLNIILLPFSAPHIMYLHGQRRRQLYSCVFHKY